MRALPLDRLALGCEAEAMKPCLYVDLAPPDPDYAAGYICRLTGDCESIVRLDLPAERIELPFRLFERFDGGLCRITLRSGYAWNWASIPVLSRWSWWRRQAPYWYRASGNHDAGYQSIEDGAFPPSYRAEFDRIMRECLAEDGSPFARRWLDWAGVRAFGWAAIR